MHNKILLQNIGLVILPFLYLASIYNNLPNEIPLHYDILGNPNRYGDKVQLWFVPVLLPLLTFCIMYFIPKLDSKFYTKPKNKNYSSIFSASIILTSAMAMLIIFMSKNFKENHGIYYIVIVLIMTIFYLYFVITKSRKK